MFFSKNRRWLFLAGSLLASLAIVKQFYLSHSSSRGNQSSQAHQLRPTLPESIGGGGEMMGMLRRVGLLPGAAPLVAEFLKAWQAWERKEVSHRVLASSYPDSEELSPTEELDRQSLENMIQEAKIEEVWRQIRQIAQSDLSPTELPERPWELLPSSQRASRRAQSAF